MIAIGSYTTEDELMQGYRESLLSFMDDDGIDSLAYHMVMSHGFMEWNKMVMAQFPAFAWRGQKNEPSDFYEYMFVLYERFYLKLIEGIEDKIDDDDKRRLLDYGFNAWIED